MKSLLKYFHTYMIFLQFWCIYSKMYLLTTQVKDTYFRKDFTPLLLESAVMYDDNGIILGSGTYALWRLAI